MASSLIVPVVTVKNVRVHPNADMLSISEVLGYQMVNGLVEDPEGDIVRYFMRDRRDDKGRRIPCDPSDCSFSNLYEAIKFRFRYKSGDTAVFFPPDTVLPDEWAERFDVKHLLKSGNRVGQAKLRGEPSFGLVVELPEGVDWKVGDNVADYYGATKWQPPADRKIASDQAPYDSEIDNLFVKYTDVENGLLLYEKFVDGEEVIATEKIHGKNFRAGEVNLADGTRLSVCGSRTSRKDPEKLRDQSIFWQVEEKVNSLVRFVRREVHPDREANVVIVFGEIFGPGVQSLHYGLKKDKGFRVFDIYVDGSYLNYDKFKMFCDLENIPTAPVIYRGPFSLEKIKEVSEGLSTLPGADHIREGVVVKPTIERRDPAIGRVIMKFISPNYNLSKHKDKDTTDV